MSAPITKEDLPLLGARLIRTQGQKDSALVKGPKPIKIRLVRGSWKGAMLVEVKSIHPEISLETPGGTGVILDRMVVDEEDDTAALGELTSFMINHYAPQLLLRASPIPRGVWSVNIPLQEILVEALDRLKNLPDPGEWPPVPATNLRSQSIGVDSIALAWEAFDSEKTRATYFVQRWFGEQWSIISPPLSVSAHDWGTISYTDINLHPATNYRYRILSQNPQGAVYSEQPPELIVKTKQIIPQAPMLDTLNPMLDSVEISWRDMSDNELGFRVERRETGMEWTSFLEIGAQAGTGPHYSLDSPLPPNTSFSYRIVAFNEAGESASQSKTTRTLSPPAEPGNLNVCLVWEYYHGAVPPPTEGTGLVSGSCISIAQEGVCAGARQNFVDEKIQIFRTVGGWRCQVTGSIENLQKGTWRVSALVLGYTGAVQKDVKVPGLLDHEWSIE